MHLAGGLLGLLVPAVCVAAFSIPHLFEAGTPVSAKSMNENFAAVGAAIENVEAKKPGLPTALPLGLNYAVNTRVFQVTETGIFYARSGGSNHGDITLVLRVGDAQDTAAPAQITCGGVACEMAVRSFSANSADILVPAGAFVQAEAFYPAESTAGVTLYWQPSDATAATLPTQVYPAL